uniref:Uncharacterized protein n=1 Tax=Athene cunicularia TaxID=194338 RepID=A0A663MI78_ATHCN
LLLGLLLFPTRSYKEDLYSPLGFRRKIKLFHSTHTHLPRFFSEYRILSHNLCFHTVHPRQSKLKSWSFLLQACKCSHYLGKSFFPLLLTYHLYSAGLCILGFTFYSPAADSTFAGGS